ncbi:serine-rich adhesin for platelets [Hyalella azteca]|uniref:Serine-rich adhesin for platelets n=1 Tax=Hyalella azteca TaxID=294128 RepID=A0A979FKX8_HYAAZ|nr:serine-rich adhesin for platelets [Hyalella azteca]
MGDVEMPGLESPKLCPAAGVTETLPLDVDKPRNDMSDKNNENDVLLGKESASNIANDATALFVVAPACGTDAVADVNNSLLDGEAKKNYNPEQLVQLDGATVLERSYDASAKVDEANKNSNLNEQFSSRNNMNTSMISSIEDGVGEVSCKASVASESSEQFSMDQNFYRDTSMSSQLLNENSSAASAVEPGSSDASSKNMEDATEAKTKNNMTEAKTKDDKGDNKAKSETSNMDVKQATSIVHNNKGDDANESASFAGSLNELVERGGLYGQEKIVAESAVRQQKAGDEVREANDTECDTGGVSVNKVFVKDFSKSQGVVNDVADVPQSKTTKDLVNTEQPYDTYGGADTIAKADVNSWSSCSTSHETGASNLPSVEGKNVTSPTASPPGSLGTTPGEVCPPKEGMPGVASSDPIIPVFGYCPKDSCGNSMTPYPTPPYPTPPYNSMSGISASAYPNATNVYPNSCPGYSGAASYPTPSTPSSGYTNPNTPCSSYVNPNTPTSGCGTDTTPNSSYHNPNTPNPSFGGTVDTPVYGASSHYVAAENASGYTGPSNALMGLVESSSTCGPSPPGGSLSSESSSSYGPSPTAGPQVSEGSSYGPSPPAYTQARESSSTLSSQESRGSRSSGTSLLTSQVSPAPEKTCDEKVTSSRSSATNSLESTTSVSISSSSYRQSNTQQHMSTTASVPDTRCSTNSMYNFYSSNASDGDSTATVGGSAAGAYDTKDASSLGVLGSESSNKPSSYLNKEGYSKGASYSSAAANTTFSNAGSNSYANSGTNSYSNTGPNNYPNTGSNGYQNPGSNSYQNPGSNSYQNPGSNSYQNPGSNCYQDPGSNGYQNPGSNSYQNPGSNSYQNPGSNSYQNPGSNGYQDPGSNGYQNPGSNSYQNPGSNSYQNPGSNGYQNPGSNSYQNPSTPGPSTPAAAPGYSDPDSLGNVNYSNPTTPASGLVSSLGQGMYSNLKTPSGLPASEPSDRHWNNSNAAKPSCHPSQHSAQTSALKTNLQSDFGSNIKERQAENYYSWSEHKTGPDALDFSCAAPFGYPNPVLKTEPGTSSIQDTPFNNFKTSQGGLMSPPNLDPSFGESASLEAAINSLNKKDAAAIRESLESFIMSDPSFKNGDAAGLSNHEKYLEFLEHMTQFSMASEKMEKFGRSSSVGGGGGGANQALEALTHMTNSQQPHELNSMLPSYMQSNMAGMLPSQHNMGINIPLGMPGSTGHGMPGLMPNPLTEPFLHNERFMPTNHMMNGLLDGMKAGYDVSNPYMMSMKAAMEGGLHSIGGMKSSGMYPESSMPSSSIGHTPTGVSSKSAYEPWLPQMNLGDTAPGCSNKFTMQHKTSGSRSTTPASTNYSPGYSKGQFRSSTSSLPSTSDNFNAFHQRDMQHYKPSDSAMSSNANNVPMKSGSMDSLLACSEVPSAANLNSTQKSSMSQSMSDMTQNCFPPNRVHPVPNTPDPHAYLSDPYRTKNAYRPTSDLPAYNNPPTSSPASQKPDDSLYWNITPDTYHNQPLMHLPEGTSINVEHRRPNCPCILCAAHTRNVRIHGAHNVRNHVSCVGRGRAGWCAKTSRYKLNLKVASGLSSLAGSAANSTPLHSTAASIAESISSTISSVISNAVANRTPVDEGAGGLIPSGTSGLMPSGAGGLMPSAASGLMPSGASGPARDPDRPGAASFMGNLTQSESGANPVYRPADNLSSNPAYRPATNLPSQPSYPSADNVPSNSSYRPADNLPSNPAYKPVDNLSRNPAYRPEDCLSSNSAYRPTDYQPSNPAFRPADNLPGNRAPHWGLPSDSLPSSELQTGVSTGAQFDSFSQSRQRGRHPSSGFVDPRPQQTPSSGYTDPRSSPSTNVARTKPSVSDPHNLPPTAAVENTGSSIPGSCYGGSSNNEHFPSNTNFKTDADGYSATYAKANSYNINQANNIRSNFANQTHASSYAPAPLIEPSRYKTSGEPPNRTGPPPCLPDGRNNQLHFTPSLDNRLDLPELHAPPPAAAGESLKQVLASPTRDRAPSGAEARLIPQQTPPTAPAAPLGPPVAATSHGKDVSRFFNCPGSPCKSAKPLDDAEQLYSFNDSSIESPMPSPMQHKHKKRKLKEAFPVYESEITTDPQSCGIKLKLKLTTPKPAVLPKSPSYSYAAYSSLKSPAGSQDQSSSSTTSSPYYSVSSSSPYDLPCAPDLPIPKKRKYTKSAEAASRKKQQSTSESSTPLSSPSPCMVPLVSGGIYPTVVLNHINPGARKKRGPKTGSDVYKNPGFGAPLAEVRGEPQSPWGCKISNEVLGMIFSRVIGDDNCIPALLRLSRVCRLWHSASLNPALWRTADLSVPRVKPRHRTEAKLCWLLTDRLHSTQHLNLSGWQEAVTPFILRLLGETCRQLRSLSLARCNKLHADNLAAALLHCTHLQRLDLTDVMGCHKPTPRGAVGQQTLQELFMAHGPRLTHLHLGHNTLTGLSRLLQTHCHQLEVLDLSRVETVGRDALLIHLEALQEGCPLLKVLKLSLTKARFNSASMAEQAASRGFPHLEQLFVATDDRQHVGINDHELERLLKNSTRLTLLDVRGCALVSDGSLVRVPPWSMEHLYLAGGSSIKRYSDRLELVVRKWARGLVDLDLAWTGDEDVLDAALGALAEDAVNLRVLNLKGSSVSVRAVRRVLERCLLLVQVNLSSCRALPRGMKRLYEYQDLACLRQQLLQEVQ